MKISQEQIKKVIKEELQKALKEGWRGYDYMDRKQRGGSGYDEYRGRPESELSYTLRYGLDLPEGHRLRNFDFSGADEFDSWQEARAVLLGDEFAEAPVPKDYV